MRVHLHGATRPNAIIVPQQSVQEGTNGMFVYLVGENHEVQLANIEAGPWYENYWVIKAGLKAGDQVIVDGVNKVQVGSQVQITKQISAKDKKN